MIVLVIREIGHILQNIVLTLAVAYCAISFGNPKLLWFLLLPFVSGLYTSYSNIYEVDEEDE